MRLLLLAACGVMLSACDRGPEVDLTNATPAEVAKAMKDSGATRAMVRPGKWSSTVAILEMNSPGMPAEMQAMMKQRIGPPQTIEACLTPADVDNPERMLGQIPASCRYEKFVMGGGKMDGKLRCDINGLKQETSVAGTYADDQYSILITNSTTAPAGSIPGQPGAPMSMSTKMKVDSKRLGECDGTERKTPTAPPAPTATPAPATQGNVQ